MTMTFSQARGLANELRDITVNPEKHDQNQWAQALKNPETNPETACGTVACLAGNAVLRAGYKLHWYETDCYDEATGRYNLVWRTWECSKPDAESRFDRQPIQDAFRDLFGLTQHQAQRITEGDNTLAQLWDYAINYSNGYITIEDVVGAFEARVQKVQTDTKAAILKAIGED